MLLSHSSSPTNSTLRRRGCCCSTGVSARHIPLRLLQFSLGLVTSDDDCTSATCAKCSCQARLQSVASRSRHTSSTATALAADTGANYFQVVHLDVSSAFWPSTVLPVTDAQQLPDLCATTWAAFRKFTRLHSATAIRIKFGERAFSYAGPHAWNFLPSSIRSLTDLKTFKKQLKTHLFTTSFTVL